MYSFGNKRSYGEKAKQPATRERVAPTQTVNLREHQLEDLADLIYNQMINRLRHKPWWKAPDPEPVNTKKQVNNRGLSLLFSGNRRDPKEYLQWESDMEKWLQSWIKLPREQELNQVVSAFTGKAYEWWQKESTQTLYKKPVQDWSDLKSRMHKEFVEKYQATPTRVTSSSSSAKEYGIKRHEEDIEDSIQQTTNQPEEDIGPLNEAYKPDPEDLRNESTCSANSTHQGVTEKKNRSKIFLHEEVIQLSSGRISNESAEDQRLPTEGFQSNQDEPSCETTCFGNLIHHRCMSNWIRVNIHCGLKVIQLLSQEMLSLPDLEAHGFNHSQTRIWRPGEAYNHSGDISDHLGGSSIILEGSDLRANPFKGRGDGVISISLNLVDLKINHGSSNHDQFPQSNSYGGHYGRANSYLVHAESRDGQISLLPDRSELVRPPEQLHEVTLVSMDLIHVLAHSHRRNITKKAQEDTKNVMGLTMEKPKKVFTEQSPYWPIKLKDRPPWASTINYGRGPRIEEEEWVILLV